MNHWLEGDETQDERAERLVKGMHLSLVPNKYHQPVWFVNKSLYLATTLELLVLQEGRCSQHAQALSDIFSLLGYEVRSYVKLKQDATPLGHIVMEVHYNGSWHLLDSNAGFMFRHLGNSFASKEEIENTDPMELDSMLVPSFDEVGWHRIVPEDHGRLSSWFTTPLSYPPTTPENLSITSSTLTWNESSDKDGDDITYQLWIGSKPGRRDRGFITGISQPNFDLSLLGIDRGWSWVGLVAHDGISKSKYDFETTFGEENSGYVFVDFSL